MSGSNDEEPGLSFRAEIPTATARGLLGFVCRCSKFDSFLRLRILLESIRVLPRMAWLRYVVVVIVVVLLLELPKNRRGLKNSFSGSRSFQIGVPKLPAKWTSKGFCDVFIRKGKRKVKRKPKGQSNFDGTESDVVVTVGNLILKRAPVGWPPVRLRGTDRRRLQQLLAKRGEDDRHMILVGELRSMVVAIPGGIGCLSHLQHVLSQAANRVYLGRQFKDSIADLTWLAQNLASRPTRIAELVPEVPTHVGCSDASGTGMGGVWLPNALPIYAASLNDKHNPGLTHGGGEATAAAMTAYLQHRSDAGGDRDGTRNPGRA
ncbi:hypothetical protein THAOC_10655, partial [Thalassiosira oceanica]